MKNIIKKGIIWMLDPLILKLGYKKANNEHFSTGEKHSYSKSNLLENFFNLIRQATFEPKHIVDVGANHGTWTREALKFFPDSIYTLLEPQAEMETSIKDILSSNPRVSFNAVGAGKIAGSFDFTIVDRDDSCNFLISPEEAKKNNLKQIKVPVVTLNEFIIQRNLPNPDLIKIDAEGCDLDVLSGASDFFGKTEIFMVEAGIVSKSYSNSILKLINFMDKNGYRLFDFTDLNRPFHPEVLWLTEIVFVRKNGMIDSYKWF